MLQVKQHYSRYLWGSNGSLHAFDVIDTETNKELFLVNWGAWVDDDNVCHLSNYAVNSFASFDEATDHVDQECDAARR